MMPKPMVQHPVSEDDVRCLSLMQREPTGVTVILPNTIDNHTVIFLMILAEPMNEFRRIAVFARVGGADCSNLNGKIPKIRGIVGIEREDFCLDVVSQINRSHLPYVLDWAAARGISGMDQMQNLHPASDYRISLSI